MPAEPNTFGGSTFDRAAERRQDGEWLAGALAADASLALVATSRGVPLKGTPTAPVTVPLADALAVTGVAGEEAILLGVESDSRALFAVDGEDADPGALESLLGEGAGTSSLRDAAVHLGPHDAGLLAYASGILHWQRMHRFCGRCGSRTDPIDAGHARRCPRDGGLNHPRTDPVVITVVGDGDRVLLGRQRSWPRGLYSALAGFVEPGESLEDAVRREIGEEAGVAVSDIRYHSSQPWPFPGSLMAGFVATYAGGGAHPRDQELEDVRWFTREAVRDAAAHDAWEEHPEGGLMLPPRMAVARRLVESWLA